MLKSSCKRLVNPDLCDTVILEQNGLVQGFPKNALWQSHQKRKNKKKKFKMKLYQIRILLQ